MTSQENIEALKRGFEAVSRLDGEAMLETMDPEVEFRPRFQVMLGGEAMVYWGHEGVREALEELSVAEFGRQGDHPERRVRKLPTSCDGCVGIDVGHCSSEPAPLRERKRSPAGALWASAVGGASLSLCLKGLEPLSQRELDQSGHRATVLVSGSLTSRANDETQD